MGIEVFEKPCECAKSLKNTWMTECIEFRALTLSWRFQRQGQAQDESGSNIGDAHESAAIGFCGFGLNLREEGDT